ncbi:uncharacterized protein E0L32_005149 [Thyridium curvatum]|uniref:BZIP domain-containing protein n=1 Tax=Thyridium curvatum TaxID=1093900 RepID=A0A507B822_9PEZI|nr:uncharacterized protein E0L32_005149 [Thyridium curvatum]TPX14754.1 hypothetical protein E0L32_005149 [Thyridium curvatum]
MENIRTSFYSDASPASLIAQPFTPTGMPLVSQPHGQQTIGTEDVSRLFEAYEGTLSPNSTMGATYSQLSEYCQSWAYQPFDASSHEAGAGEWTPNTLYASYRLSSSLHPFASVSTVDETPKPRKSPSSVIIYEGASGRPSIVSIPSPRPPKPNHKAKTRSTIKPTKYVPKGTAKQLPLSSLGPRKVARHGPPPPPPALIAKDYRINDEADEDDDGDDDDVSNDDENDSEKFGIERQRARNRLATSRCRAKAKAAHSKLEEHSRAAAEHHDGLVASVAQLRDQVLDLKSELLRHVDCGCPLIQAYIKNAARHLGEGIPGPVAMPPGMPRIGLAELEHDHIRGDD